MTQDPDAALHARMGYIQITREQAEAIHKIGGNVWYRNYANINVGGVQQRHYWGYIRILDERVFPEFHEAHDYEFYVRGEQP